MADKLELIITVKDNASRGLKSVNKTLVNLGKTAFKVGKVGFGALTAGILAAIPATLDAEDAQADLMATLKSTGEVAGVTAKEANALATSLAAVTGFSNDAIVSAEAMLLTFVNIGEDVFPRTTEMALNMAEKFGGLDSASIQLGKALNDPITGVGALMEVGVSFTEAQKEMIKGMVEAGDVAGAQTVILNELEKEVGGMARTMGQTNRGKFKRFINQMTDIGSVFAGPLLNRVALIADRLGNFFRVLSEGQLLTLEGAKALGFLFSSYDVGNAFFAVIPLIKEFLANLLNLRDSFQAAGLWSSEFAESLGLLVGSDKVTEFFIAIMGPMREFGDTVKEFVLEHGPSLIETFAKVGAILGTGIIVATLTSIAAGIVATLAPIVLVVGGLALLVRAYETNFLGIKDAVQSFVGWFIDTAMPSIVGFISNTAIPALTNLINWLKKVWQDVAPILADMLTWFVDTGFPAMVTFITDTVIPALSGLVGWLKKVWEDVKPHLQELFLWFMDSAMPTIVDFITNTVIPILSTLIGWLKDIWVAVSPFLTKLFDWVMTTGFEAIRTYLVDFYIPAIKLVIDTLKDIWLIAKPLLQQFVDWMGSTFAAIKTSVVDPLVSAFQSVIDTIQGVWDKVMSLGDLSLPGFLGSLPGLAGGGSFSGLAMTGERGRELVYAPGGATVIPNDQTESIANNFNLTVNTSGDTTNVMNDFHTMEALASG